MDDMKFNTKIALEFVFFAVILFILGWFLSTFKVLFGPLVISGLLAYLLYPAVTWLSDRTRIDRKRFVILVFLLFLVVLILAVVYLAPVVVKQAKLLSRQTANLPTQMVAVQKELEGFLGFSLPLEPLISELETDIEQIFNPERAFRIILSATSNVIWLVVILTTTFHLLRDWESLREWLFSLLPEHLAPEYRQLHQEIKNVWQSYLRGQLLVMLFVGIGSGISAAVLGLPNALLLGILAGALDIIPNIGPTISTGMAAVVAWIQGSSYLPVSDLTLMLIVIIVFSIIQMLESVYIVPRVMGRHMNLHPGIVMVAVVGTLVSLGTLMTLIVVPIISSIVVILGFIRRKRAGLEAWPVEKDQAEMNQLEGESS